MIVFLKMFQCTMQQHANQRILYLEYSRIPWLHEFMNVPDEMPQNSLTKSETSPFMHEK